MTSNARNKRDDVESLSPFVKPEWVSENLLLETVRVFSGAYERPVSEEEAVHILHNVHRLAEVLLRASEDKESCKQSVD